MRIYTVYFNLKFSRNFALLDLSNSSCILRTHVNPVASYSGTDVASGFHERASARCLSEVCPPERQTLPGCLWIRYPAFRYVRLPSLPECIGMRRGGARTACEVLLWYVDCLYGCETDLFTSVLAQRLLQSSITQRLGLNNVV